MLSVFSWPLSRSPLTLLSLHNLITRRSDKLQPVYVNAFVLLMNWWFVSALSSITSSLCRDRIQPPPPPPVTLKKLGMENKWIKSRVHPPLILAQYSSRCLDALRPSVYFAPHWPTSTENEDNTLAQRHVCQMYSFYVGKWNCMETGEKGDHCVPVFFLSLSLRRVSCVLIAFRNGYGVCTIMKMSSSDILLTFKMQQLFQNQLAMICPL